jgi:hypothetical protein
MSTQGNIRRWLKMHNEVAITFSKSKQAQLLFLRFNLDFGTIRAGARSANIAVICGFGLR